MAQPPFPQYQAPVGPQKQKRGPLVLLGVLVLVLAVVAVLGAVVIVRRDDDKKSEPKVRTKPASPGSVEFRRVLKAEPGACPSPLPTGDFCGPDATYTLGKVELDGSHVTEVKAEESKQGTTYWYVAVSLDKVGTQLFGQLTTDLAKRPPGENLLAIVVRNEVVAAPTVSSPITAGQIQISGNFTRDDVEALAAKITG
jgi:hypothetical protein